MLNLGFFASKIRAYTFVIARLSKPKWKEKEEERERRREGEREGGR